MQAMQIEFSEYVSLSGMMFVEYAVWGAWAPVLAARLLGTLKLGGRKTGWIYATLPIACIVSPMISGHLADQSINAEILLAASMSAGALFLFLAARQTEFRPLFVMMLLHSFFFASTLPLCNAILFAATSDIATQGAVFIWAPVGWAASGHLLSVWRMTRKQGTDDRDCLFLGAGMAAIMPLVALSLPSAPPGGAAAAPVFQTVGMLADPSFALFIGASLAGIGLMQFYLIGTARFLQDKGFPGKLVPGTMAIGQVAQTLATLFLLAPILGAIGFKWSLVLGAGCWFVLYCIHIFCTSRTLLAIAQGLYGIAFMFFALIGMIYAEAVAPAEIRSSVQAMFFVATNGFGFLLGTQFAGRAIERATSNDIVNWASFWKLPAIVLAGILAVLIAFFDPAI